MRKAGTLLRVNKVTLKRMPYNDGWEQWIKLQIPMGTILRILLIIVSFIPCTVFSQNHRIILTDTLFMKPVKTDSMSLKDSLPDGRWLVYYDTAKTAIYQDIHYKDSQPVGIMKIYNTNGQLVRERYYAPDTSMVKVLVWNPETGKPTEGYSELNGIRHGTYRKWNGSGALIQKGYYNQGKQDSTWIFYDHSGLVIREEEFNKGEPVPLEE